MKADPHILTWCSTGAQTPEEAIQEAISKGIGLISITDDETIEADVGLEDIARGGYRFLPSIQHSTG